MKNSSTAIKIYQSERNVPHLGGIGKNIGRNTLGNRAAMCSMRALARIHDEGVRQGHQNISCVLPEQVLYRSVAEPEPGGFSPWASITNESKCHARGTDRLMMTSADASRDGHWGAKVAQKSLARGGGDGAAK